MTQDAQTSEHLTERQQRILELIIQHYVSANRPVGSKALVEPLDVSSATIRNDMVVLEEAGLITSPHTSAGRIPTEAGYRYYVQHIQGTGQLSLVERRMIAHQFHQAPTDIEQWMRLAATMLSRTAQSASLVTAPYSRNTRFKHLELIATQGRMVLMVLVLHNGDVRQRIGAAPPPAAVLRGRRGADRGPRGGCGGRRPAVIRPLPPPARPPDQESIQAPQASASRRRCGPLPTSPPSGSAPAAPSECRSSNLEGPFPTGRPPPPRPRG